MVHSQWLSWFSLLMILSKTAKKKKKKIHRKLQFLISLAFSCSNVQWEPGRAGEPGGRRVPHTHNEDRYESWAR